jgi:hypothetical protein
MRGRKRKKDAVDAVRKVNIWTAAKKGESGGAREVPVEG